MVEQSRQTIGLGWRRGLRVAGNALMRLILVGAVLFVLFSNLSGDEDPGDSAGIGSGGTRDRMFLQEPISASAQARLDGQHYLFLMTKQGEERIETADLRVILVEPGESLEQVSWIHTSMSVETPPSAIAVVGDYVYIGMSRQGDDRPALGVVDVSDPSHPADANLISVDEPIMDLAGNEDGPLVSVSADGEVRIFDLARPEQPAVRTSFTVSVSTVPRIELVGSTLVVDDMSAVELIDLSTLEEPGQITRLQLPGSSPPAKEPRAQSYLIGDEPFDVAVPPASFLDVAVDGNLIAAASSDRGLLLAGAEGPAPADSVATLEVPGRAVSVALDDERAYLLAVEPGEGAEARFRLHRVGISDPARPRILETSREFTALPRYQDVRVLNGEVVLLFDDSIIRIPDREVQT